MTDDSDTSETPEMLHDAMSLDGDVEKLTSYYDRWAENYDADLSDARYGLPAMMIATLREAIGAAGDLAHLGAPATPVLDAGCGTGLVGLALHEIGYRNISGVDLSPKMVEVAQRLGVYRRLEAPVDLTRPPSPRFAGSADIVTVGGVFTVGHVPPETLVTVADLVADGGLLIVSTRKAYNEQTGFDGVAGRAIDDGLLELLVHIRDAPYTVDSTGDYRAFRVRHRPS